jgi:Protein kinase domain
VTPPASSVRRLHRQSTGAQSTGALTSRAAFPVTAPTFAIACLHHSVGAESRVLLPNATRQQARDPCESETRLTSGDRPTYAAISCNPEPIGNGPAGLLLGHRWTLDVADGLVHAHSNDIFHRDARPSNLLLDGRSHAALCDFGVAEDNITGEGSNKAYPHLIAPEMFETGTTGGTEVWMLGALGYRLLVGEYPFPLGGYGLAAGTVVQPHLANPQIPMALARVLQQALAVDPADRYEDIDAMRKALLAANPVTEFVEAPDGTAIARWQAKVPRGIAVVEVVPTARSTFTARLRLDQGSGPRTIDCRPARSSPAQARRDARTYLRAVVEGRAP